MATITITLEVDRAHWIALKIQANVEAFQAHRIDYDRFTARQRQLWGYATGSRDLHEGVSQALR